MCFISCHNHDDTSNFKLLDCINSVEELIRTAGELNYKGLAITNHETVSSHVQAIKKARELKQKNIIPQDFKLILGNEIYLVDDVEEVKNNYKSGETKFPHFLLLSKNKKGHEQLRRLSSIAWSKNYFRTGLMERTPTSKKDLESIVKENPNNIIATTACLGSESSIHLLSIRDAEKNNNKELANYHRQKLHHFILWCIEVFGRGNFFIELQPGVSEEQRYVNSKLIPMAEFYDLKLIITTDTHYLRPEHRNIHKSFLNAKEGEREVESFYADTYMHSIEEIYAKMDDYIDRKIIEEAIQNTLLIGELVEDYTIEQETIIPKIDLPAFEIRHIFKPAYSKYEYIKKMVHSESEQDRYLIKLLEDGFDQFIPRNTLTKEKFHQILARIDIELGELWEISQVINQSTSSYYITVAKIVDLIWADDCGNSIVGSGRGSAGGFLICFLLGITQINPLEYGIEMPHWRHIHRSRPDIGALDIDLDTEGNKRPRIIQALKDHFGEDRVLQVCTYGRIGSKSALQVAARGLGVDSDTSKYLSSLIPWERGQNWSLNDCVYGNEEIGRKPVTELVNELEKLPGLLEIALMIEKKIDKRSIHAGGVILFNEEYYKSNAMMRAPNGMSVTQFNLDDSQAVGNMKFDLLTIEAADKIRTTLDLLLEYKEIEWQGTLRSTFNKYLHPEVIDRDDPKLYKMLGDGSVSDLFQFSTDIGHQSAIKVKPKNLIEVASANSLMRLMSDGEQEQPIDTFVRYKNNIDLWYEDMRKYGLTEVEIDIMKEHLLKLNGVADTQESVMLLSMDQRISGFDVKWANKLRKAIAKPSKSKKELEEVRNEFFKRGEELKTSDRLLSYVWEVQIKRQLGYSFSILHTLSYSVIALQELNLNYHYNPLYWQTACLSVNSGSAEDDEEYISEDDYIKKKVVKRDYGKVATAIGNIQNMSIQVSLPDINKAGFGFTPDIQNNTIIFGLNGISGVGEEVVKLIIDNRPYLNFVDFYNRMVKTKVIKNSQMIQLIKAGCFDSFDSRVNIMTRYISLTTELKNKLTLANIKSLIEYSLISEQYHIYVRYYKFKEYISKFVYKTINSPKDKLLILNEIATTFFMQHFSDESIREIVDGQIVISEKQFKKEYDKKIEPLKSWVQNKDLLKQFNDALLQEALNKQMTESISKWEMDSVSFYSSPHELINVNNEKYNIINFYEQPEEPTVTGYYEWRGRQIPEYDLCRISGTVLDKNSTRHTISLLTTKGVVTVKFHSGAFSFYDRQISEIMDGKKKTIEKSWFTRGNKLLITGFRREGNFIPKKYKNSIYQHTVALIEKVNENGDLVLQLERA